MDTGSERMNAAYLFVDRNVEQGRGGMPAIYYQDAVHTYADVLADVNRAGNALRELGVQQEQRVLMILPDCPEFVSTFFGAIKIGAVPVPVNTLLKPADYRYLLQDSRAVVCVASAAAARDIQAMRAELPHLRHLITAPDQVPGLPQLGSLMAQASAELTPADTHRDDFALWLYSSGTTGFPKGTVHLQHDMAFCAEHYARAVLGIGPGDRSFSVAKLFFAYGLGNALYFPFYVGASTVLMPERPEPLRVHQAVSRYRPTLFFSVPTSYNALLQVPPEQRGDFSSVRLCVSAGEALPPEVFRRWREAFGLEILDGIGSTEAMHIFISNRPGKVRPGSSGTLVPGYEARILDDDLQPVRPGDTGTLWIKGDSVAALYWNKHERSKSTFNGDWLNTGDRYRQDEEGYFWYAGRSDDMIKAGGIWVSPVEVEAALMEHPAVLECCVVGRADSDGLMKPMAFVVLGAGSAPSAALAAELQNFVKGRIAPYKYPRWVEFVPEIPKTATGKLQRFKLRALANADPPASA